MEAHTDKVPMTLQALGILCALPLAMFALWADYLGRHIEKIKADKNAEFNPELESARVRMNSAIVILFQLLLFMGSGELRKEHPLIVNLFFVVAILFQGWMQASTERKIGLPSASPKESFKRVAHVFVWILGSIASYAGIVLFTVAAFAVLADTIHANRPIGFGLVCLGAVLGLVGGMGFNFALAPLHLRKLLFTRKFETTLPLQAQYIHATFLNHGLKIPHLYVLESERARNATAFISGFCTGKGIFRPALFISRSLAEKLTPPELQAVIRHEISHMLLGHIQKRFLYTATIMGGLTTLAVAFMLFSGLVFPKNSVIPQLTPLLAIASFFFAFKWLGQQTKQQELEADFYAIDKLGTQVEHFSSALRKIDQANGVAATRAGHTHPATEFRIALLESLASKTQQRKTEKSLAA